MGINHVCIFRVLFCAKAAKVFYSQLKFQWQIVMKSQTLKHFSHFLFDIWSCEIHFVNTEIVLISFLVLSLK